MCATWPDEVQLAAEVLLSNPCKMCLTTHERILVFCVFIMEVQHIAAAL